MSVDVKNLLSTIPQSLREELFVEFNKILKNYRESRWEPAELNGGKLCEIIYSILSGLISGAYSGKAVKPTNFYDACKAFEKADNKKYSRSIRIQIPRVLIALYEVRNNRGVGHVGGDVNPNHMDATFVVSCVKWLMAELIRIFHDVDIDVAASAIDLIIQKEEQIVWNVGKVKRVLRADIGFKEQVLLLLYDCVDGISTDEKLFNWVEYSNKGMFKRNILKKLHNQRFVEYQANGELKISPKGIDFVEAKILK